MKHAPVVLVSAMLLSPLVGGVGDAFDSSRFPAVLLIASLMLADLALGSPGSPGRLGPLLLSGLLLGATQLGSLLSALDPAEGVAPILALAAGLAAFVYARSPRVPLRAAREWVPEMLLLPAVSLSVVAFFQAALGVDPVSTLGNRNYTAAVAGMLLPPVIGGAAAARSGGARLGFGVVGLSLVAGLLLLQSRGGALAALGGLALMASLLWNTRARPAALPWIGGAAGLLVLGALLQLPGQVSAARRETGEVRLELWKASTRLFADRPWLGWGAGGFGVAYPPYRSIVEARLSQKYEPDHFVEAHDPHSSWVQSLADTGIAGLAAFVLVAAVGARLVRFRTRFAGDPRWLVTVAGLGGGAAVYLLAGAFNTLTYQAAPTVLFWVFLGLVDRSGASEHEPAPASGGALGRAMAAVGALAAFLACSGMYRKGEADRAYAAAMRTSVPRDRADGLEKALQASPGHWKSRAALVAASLNLGKVPESLGLARAVLSRRPYHAPTLNNLAVALLREGKEEEAESWLVRADEVAPHCYLTAYNRGALELVRKRPERAREFYLRAIDLNPGHAASHFSLGETYLLSGDVAGAVGPFRQARALGLEVAGAIRREHPSHAGHPLLAEFVR